MKEKKAYNNENDNKNGAKLVICFAAIASNDDINDNINDVMMGTSYR